MSQFYSLTTTVGRAKIANALALGQTVALTKMAVGDGGGSAVTPTEGATNLVNEVYRADINLLTVDPNNSNWLIAELVIPMTEGGFTIREAGIFDSAGALIAFANFPETYKPVVTEGSGRELTVRIYLQVESTDAVELIIDPTVVLATRSWVATNYVSKADLAGGTTGQVLAKASNADNDTEWLELGDGIPVDVTSRVEKQTLAAGQTTVNLSTLTTDGLALYIEGAREFGFTVVNDTQLTLDTSYPDGTQAWFVQNDPVSQKAEYKPIAGGGVFQTGYRYYVTSDTAPITLPAVAALQTGAAVEIIKAIGITPNYAVNGSNGELINKDGTTDTSADHVDNIKVIFVYNEVTNQWEI